MKLSTHLGFSGSCEEAMNFYAETLGGAVEFKMTWGESPMAGQVAADYRAKIMHMSLRVGTATISAADELPGTAKPPQGFALSVDVPDADKGRSVFAALSAGGSVGMEFQETFWTRGFGMCVDRFGVPWMVNTQAGE